MTESGFEINGITLFYNDFYARLDEVDENKKIEAVLAAHSTGQNKIAEKGAIIIRIVNYVLSLKQNDEQTQFRLYALGKAHAKRAIRPYMYSVFVQCMLYTISNQLGLHASHEVMEAWVNIFSFIMKSMLPLAIVGQTIETGTHMDHSYPQSSTFNHKLILKLPIFPLARSLALQKSPSIPSQNSIPMRWKHKVGLILVPSPISLFFLFV